MTRKLTCSNQDCSANGVNRCAQCGDIFCNTHIRSTRNHWVCCTSCLSATLQRIMVCAVRSARLEEAAQVLGRWAAGADALPEAQLYLAMIRAEQGAFDSALTLLHAARSVEGHEPAISEALTETMAQIYLSRAAKAVANKQMIQAAQDVALAAQLNPHLKEAQQAQLMLRDWQVLAHIHAGQLQKALQGWEEERLERPTDLTLIHRLAILYYQLASDSSNAAATESYWRKAIAAWATVLHSEAFFRQWRQERWQDAGLKCTDEELTQARKALEERLLRDLRDLAQKEGADQRLQALDMVWSLELESAKLMSEWLERNQVSNWPSGFACGPLMLVRLSKNSLGRPLVIALQRQLPTFRDENAQKLQTYLSPLGLAHLLIEQNRLDQAIAILSRANSPKSQRLLGVALCAKGQELVQLYQWPEALAAFEWAQAAGADVKAYSDAIVEAGLKGSKAILDANSKQSDSAIAHLKRCLKLIGDHPEIKANLGATIAQQARVANNADRFEEAARLIRQALKYSPDDPQIRHFARVTMSNLAHAILDEQPQRAVSLLEEALTYEQDATMCNILVTRLLNAGHEQEALQFVRRQSYDRETAAQLHITLHNHGLRLANHSNLDRGIEFLKEALKLP